MLKNLILDDLRMSNFWQMFILGERFPFKRQTWLVESAPLTWNISGWLFWVSAVPCVCGWFGHCCHPAGLELNCAPIWLISPERKSKSKTERWIRKTCSLLKTFGKIFTESVSWRVVVTVYLLVIWCVGHWSRSPAHLAKGRGSGGWRGGAKTSHVKLRRRTLSNMTCHLIDKECLQKKITFFIMKEAIVMLSKAAFIWSKIQ